MTAEPSQIGRILAERFCMAGCRAIKRIALRSKPIPGGMRCQGEAPDGWGSGIRSNARRLRRSWNERPTTSSSFSKARNCAIASLPTGMMSRGRKKIDFIIHPGRAIPDLVRRRHSVAARGRLAGKAAADRGKINPRANLHFIQMTEFVEPSEECAASRPGERLAQNRLSHPRRLADEHHLAEDRSAGNGRRQHPRAAPALEQSGDVLIQQLLCARRGTHHNRSPITGGRTRKSD